MLAVGHLEGKKASRHSKTDWRLLLRAIVRRALPDDESEGDPRLQNRIEADYVRLARNLGVESCNLKR